MQFREPETRVAPSAPRVAVSRLREPGVFMTPSSQPRAVSTVREPAVSAPQRQPSPVPLHEHSSIGSLCTSPGTTTRYVSAVRSQPPSAEMMEVHRVQLMEELPVLSFKAEQPEVAFDVSFLEKRMEEQESLLTAQMSTLDGRLTSTGIQLGKLMDLVHEVGAASAANSQRLARIEDMSRPAGDGDLWLKERGDVYFALEKVEQTCISTCEQLNELSGIQSPELAAVTSVVEDYKSQLEVLQAEVRSLHKVVQQQPRGRVDAETVTRAEFRALSERVDIVKMGTGSGAADLSELRKVVSDLADMSRLQGEQIESLSS
eukprot:2487452-Amphidinium_carterae.1